MTISNTHTILLADDDDDDRLLAIDALRRTHIPHRLEAVCDGEELMDYLHRRGKYAPPAHSPRPHLLLLDLNMPKMDGREALREMKNDRYLRSIPVVILSTSQTEEDIGNTYSLGANSFIAKPDSFEALVEIMRAACNYWIQIVRLPSEN